LCHFIPFPPFRYNNIRQNSLPVEYALIDGEVEEIDSLIREILQVLTWNSESESLYLQNFILFSELLKFSRVASFICGLNLAKDIFLLCFSGNVQILLDIIWIYGSKHMS
jgi:hypothetical protein